MSPVRDEIRRLHRQRPRSPFHRGSVVALLLVALGAGSWALVRLVGFFDVGREANVRRFLAEDATPFPLRGGEFTWTGLWEWGAGMWATQGREGAHATLGIAVVAILLAAALALPLALAGARTLADRDPYLTSQGRGGGPVGRRSALGAFLRVSMARVVRGLSVLLRAVPEYVLAFLLLALFGSGAWPAILALAAHNAGILGRLGAETAENLDRAPLAALRRVGTRRLPLALFGILPAAFPRFLLYFFYRFETCIREATVLGILGIASLGAFVQEARARQRYDEMLFLVLVGGAIVLAADLVSQITRAWIRRET